MDQTTCSYSTSSSSSSNRQQHPPKRTNSTRPLYLNSLYSMNKPLKKPITKQFIAPLPWTPPKVYNVDSSDFKDAVRELTSMPKFQHSSTSRLKKIAPPPLVLSTIVKPSVFSKPTSPPPSDGDGMGSSLPDSMLSPEFCNLLDETLQTSRCTEMDCFRAMSPMESSSSPKSEAHYSLTVDEPMSPLGFILSPTSLSWCSSLLLSPGNLSALN